MANALTISVYRLKYLCECFLQYLNMHICISAQYYTTVLAISNGTGIGLFNLWNLSNVSCGTVNDDFIRSDIIDRFRPDISCPYQVIIFLFTELFLLQLDSIYVSTIFK